MLQTFETIRSQRNIQNKKKPIVVVAGKWRIGEDLLPRNMTVTVEPNGREFFPAYCAGCLGTFHKIFNKNFCQTYHQKIYSTVCLKGSSTKKFRGTAPWGFEGRRRGFEGQRQGVSRGSAKGFRGAAPLIKDFSALSFRAVP